MAGSNPTIGGGCVMPSARSVRQFLVDLLGKEVSVASVPPMRFRAMLPLTVAIYGGASKAEAVALFDLKLAVSAGAALSSIAPPVAEEQLASGAPREAVRENLQEVASALARCLVDAPSRDLSLRSLHVSPPEPLPARVAPLMTRPAGRVDLRVEIAGHPAGRLTILVR